MRIVSYQTVPERLAGQEAIDLEAGIRQGIEGQALEVDVEVNVVRLDEYQRYDVWFTVAGRRMARALMIADSALDLQPPEGESSGVYVTAREEARAYLANLRPVLIQWHPAASKPDQVGPWAAAIEGVYGNTFGEVQLEAAPGGWRLRAANRRVGSRGSESPDENVEKEIVTALRSAGLPIVD